MPGPVQNAHYCLTSPVRRTKKWEETLRPLRDSYSGRFGVKGPHEEGVDVLPAEASCRQRDEVKDRQRNERPFGTLVEVRREPAHDAGQPPGRRRGRGMSLPVPRRIAAALRAVDALLAEHGLAFGKVKAAVVALDHHLA